MSDPTMESGASGAPGSPVRTSTNHQECAFFSQCQYANNMFVQQLMVLGSEDVIALIALEFKI